MSANEPSVVGRPLWAISSHFSPIQVIGSFGAFSGRSQSDSCSDLDRDLTVLDGTSAFHQSGLSISRKLANFTGG